MEQTQLTEVTRRTDVVSYALLSEINHFHSERAEDFKQGMKNYLNEQIIFYEKVSTCLQGVTLGNKFLYNFGNNFLYNFLIPLSVLSLL